MSRAQNRTILLRVSEDWLEYVDDAAYESHQSRSEFVKQAALHKAKRMLEKLDAVVTLYRNRGK
jgi:uncharacterized protein (DUF1778 family)